MKDVNLKTFEKEFTELGDTLALAASLAKTIDVIADDECNFKKQDFENLTVIMRNIIQLANRQYSDMENLLGL